MRHTSCLTQVLLMIHVYMFLLALHSGTRGIENLILQKLELASKKTATIPL